MISPGERAASICRQRSIPDLALGEPMEVAAEYCLQVEITEALEKIVGVGRARRSQRSHRKMREEDTWPLLVQFREMVLEPLKSRGLHARVGAEQTLRCVQTHELPTLMSKLIID